MPSSKNALLQMEQGATLVPFVALTNSGDQQIFTPADLIMSGEDGYEPVIRANGIVTGYKLVTPAVSGSNDVVDIAAFTANSIGLEQAVAAAADEAVTRPTTNKLINSITMTSAGAIAVAAGTEGTDFVETRGAAGGPPEIAADSVELAQVRLDSPTAAAITEAEIFQTPGQHSERHDVPALLEVNTIGLGQTSAVSAQRNAHVKYASAQPLIHASGTPKKVYAQYYAPVLADISDTVDFVPVETSHSVSSQQVYQRTASSTSESIGQGGFKALTTDNVNDVLVQNKNKVKTFRFFQNKNKTAYVLTQGMLGIKRSYPADDLLSVDATISAERASVEFAS